MAAEKDYGWISIHRKIEENAIWSGDEPFDRRSAWIDLIIMANHEDKEIVVNGCPLIIKRGQRFTSVRKLSVKWHWSPDRVTRYIRTLKSLNMVRTDSTHNGTLLTIVNYDLYQCLPYTDKDTNKDTIRTHSRTRAEHRQVTNNNDNNENNVTMNNKEEATPLTDPWGNKFQ